MNQPPSSRLWLIWILIVLILFGGLVFFARSFKHQQTLISPSLSGYEIEMFAGDAQVYQSKTSVWVKADRGLALEPGDILKTGKKSEIDFKIADQMRFRLKENSQIFFTTDRSSQNTDSRFRIKLDDGSLYGASEKKLSNPLEILANDLEAVTKNGAFLLQKNSTQPLFLGWMSGKAQVTVKQQEPFALKALEKVVGAPDRPTLSAEKIANKDWFRLQEVYDLIPKSAAMEAAQLDLSQEAGGMFKYVFDHGTFFTPKFGYANREFIKKENGDVYLEIEYDVFPAGSFVGMYLKTRELDVSKFKKIKFEARRAPQDNGYPESMKIELKSNSGTARSFVPRQFSSKWTTYEYPIVSTKLLDIREITFVLHHDSVGGHYKGFLQLRNFELEVVDEKPAITTPAINSTPEAKDIKPVKPLSA